MSSLLLPKSHAIITPQGQALSSENNQALMEAELKKKEEVFLDFTDKTAFLFKERNVVARSCNYIVARVTVADKTKGGLHKSQKSIDKETRESGYARVIAVPNNVSEDNAYNDIQPGMFIMARFSSFSGIVRDTAALMTGVSDFPDGILFTVLDQEIQATQPNPRKQSTNTDDQVVS